MPDDKTVGTTGKQDLVLTRVFDASVERVWQAWTDPEQVKRCWGPDGFSCPFARGAESPGKVLAKIVASRDF